MNNKTFNVKPRVLFFGKSDCQYCDKIIENLKVFNFEVEYIYSKIRNEKLPDYIKNWNGDYIFCFRSYYILPKELLEKAKIAAINFHPAPTEYPGSGGINLALYHNEKMFGVTAHLMNEKIDNGEIIECRRFPIFDKDTVKTLLERTHLKAYDLVIDTLMGLSLGGRDYLEKKLEKSNFDKWGRIVHKINEINLLSVVEPNCTKEELECIIRATKIDNFLPYINLHGYKFIIKL